MYQQLPISADEAGDSEPDMEVAPRPRPRALLFLASSLVIVPIASLLGWVIDSPYLKAVVPGLTPMNPVVAVCFLSLTAALLSTQTASLWGRLRSSGLALVVAGAAITRIVASLQGHDKTIDTLLFAQKLDAELRPNRMAFTTAWCLLGCALVVLILSSSHRLRTTFAQLTSIAVAVTGIIVVNCYAAEVLAGQAAGTGVPMALHVAVLFVVFCVATLLMTSETGPSRVLMENTHGALFARRLMLSLLIAPPLLGWLTHCGQIAGLYGVEYKHALLMTLMAVGFAALVWVGARANSRAEAHLRQVEKELRSAKEGLEERILERTAELTHANAKLTSEIEERQSLQEQLLHSQKMESIGSLAGGIAHDFNNLLTGVMGYAELAQMKLPPDSPVQGDLDEVRKAGQRAADLTKQLLTFARKEVVEPQVINLGELSAGLENLLRRLVGEDIALIATTQDNLGSVKVDPSQFEQVLVNLAVNARDAMAKGGQLVIDVRNADVDEDQPTHRDVMKAGQYVVLTVTDTGCGMPKEVQSQVFDPFYTTKEKGKGTGLGLSTCYGIVKNAGGYIWIYSEIGTGTTFRIYLPRVDELPQTMSVSNAVAARGNGETILVVEDEDTVRSIATQVLREAGYQVLEAANGKSALSLVAQYQGAIDLLVTDVIMPGMTGRELAEVLHMVRPDIKVLYMSGYTDDAMVLQGVFSQGMAFLQKPFTSTKLTHKLREVLDERLAA